MILQPTGSPYRIVRNDGATCCRSAFRLWVEPGNRGVGLGFRLVWRRR